MKRPRAHVRNSYDPEALEVEELRIKLKNILHQVLQCYLARPPAAGQPRTTVGGNTH